MTSATTKPEEVISLPRKHRWGDGHTILPADAIDGNERTERTCIQCSLVKITVHPPHGLPWREWRTAAGGMMMGEGTPRCMGEGEPK